MLSGKDEQMRKIILTAIAVSGPCVGATASAAVYEWTLSGAYDGFGTLTTGAADGRGFDITAFTGTAADEQIIGLLGGDPGPAGAVSPSGLFFYDNLLFPGDPAALIDPNGLLFATDTHPEASIWSNGGSDYDYTSEAGGRYDQDAPTGEVFRVAAVPEPSTIGFSALTVLAALRLRRRSQSRSSCHG
jgi:hypothetical protein